MEVGVPGGADWHAERFGENEAERPHVARSGDMHNVGSEGAEPAFNFVAVAVEE